MVRLLLSLFMLTLGVSSIYGQDHFMVELEAFSPSDQQVIQTLKGRKAEQFLAKDIAGEEVSLYTAADKIRLIWFWSAEDPASTKILPYFNLLQLDELDHIWTYGFCKEDKEIASKITSEQAVIFSIIPNASPLGEMAYGGDLGQNRLFVVDQVGTIVEIFPRSFFLDRTPEEAISVVRGLITQLKFR